MTDKNNMRILSPQLDREFHEKMDEAKDYAIEQKNKAADVIKAHPFLAVGGALVGGLLIGILATRRRD